MRARQVQGRAVFLDRDGVINALVYYPEAGIIDSPLTERQFRLLPKVPQAIRRLNRLGLLVIVVSNQPGIAKGRFTMRVLKNVERKLMAQIAGAGARIDAIYYCLHHPEARVERLRKRCACRKPGIGMLKAAARRFNLSLKDCYMVGDNVTDIVAGRRAGCTTIFIGRRKCELCQLAGHSDPRPDYVAPDLWSATGIIRELSRAAVPRLAGASVPTSHSGKSC